MKTRVLPTIMSINGMYEVHIVVLLMFSCQCIAKEGKVNDALLPNVNHSFPVDIGAVNHIVQGRVSADARPGSLVPSNVVIEGNTDTDLQVHLRVEVRDSVYTRPHVYDPRITVNTSDPSNPQFKHPVIHFKDSVLPYGMEFVVLHSDAFDVDKDRFIVVSDFSKLEEQTRVHFHVILKDKLSETHYVSNHLPFVVEIEYPRPHRNPNAALFAGVLILTILAISLLIPFVVRAKRRTKAGKPVCACGSAEDDSDSASNDSAPEYGKQRKISLGGKDNLAMILDNGRMNHHRPSVDHHATIQDHMVRSTSNMKFQPHYLDPHYQDIYLRPEFHNEPPLYAVSNSMHGVTNPFHRAYGLHSNRSSMNSYYNYPINFNHASMLSKRAANCSNININHTNNVNNNHNHNDKPSDDTSKYTRFYGNSSNNSSKATTTTLAGTDFMQTSPNMSSLSPNSNDCSPQSESPRLMWKGGVAMASDPEEIESLEESTSFRNNSSMFCPPNKSHTQDFSDARL